MAINIGIEGGAQRRIVRGIIRYCQTHTAWNFVEYQGMPLARSPHPLKLQYTGLITALNDAADMRIARTTQAMGIPVVAINQGLPIQRIAMVCSNDLLIGEMGARFFLDKGFRNFAYYGTSQFRWSRQRKNGFGGALKKAGFTAATQEASHTLSLDKAMPRLHQWLAGLPRPLAVMASDDLPARHILAACRENGLHVPEQVAVLGVDDDDILCEMATPPLSSIMQDCDRIGYEAAALLDKMMQRKQPSFRAIQIPPLRIVARRSTDITAIEDPEVAQALQLIHSKAGEALSVKTLLRDIPVSRRTLERRFTSALGRSPADEIRRCRLERAKLLLRTSTLKISRVAIQSGFCDARTMAVVFRREMKLSASAYRRKFRDN
ncbi:MAG: substrate-binding domain-containing protein [Planctomycetia bacterium]|nr:substrate-binding domain-containing protein [Planctomycetia bacterium]